MATITDRIPNRCARHGSGDRDHLPSEELIEALHTEGFDVCCCCCRIVSDEDFYLDVCRSCAPDELQERWAVRYTPMN